MVGGKRLNILLSAFSCQPGKGGEQGVGWNFSKSMAAHHNIWVLTRRDNKKVIDEELLARPLRNINFIYYDFSFPFLNDKRLSEQAYYILWQMLVLPTYKKAAKNTNFDLVHHLTYNQYRSPSLGFFIKKPFIMGPIGGAETIAPAFFQDLFFSGKLKEKWRTLGLDIYLFSTLFRLKAGQKQIVFSSERNLNKIDKYLGKYHSQVIPAIAIDEQDFTSYGVAQIKDTSRPFTIIYAGTAKDWKGLLILLRAVKLAFENTPNIRVKLIGIRNEVERLRVSQWVESNNLSEKVQLIDFLPRVELIKELSDADISVYPAFRDSGSMSVLEACALGCAVVCFDAGGQDAFPNDILFKIPVSEDSYETNLDRLSEKLKWCYEHPAELNTIGAKARDYVLNHFTWQQKVAVFSKLYTNLLESKKSVYSSVELT